MLTPTKCPRVPVNFDWFAHVKQRESAHEKSGAKPVRLTWTGEGFIPTPAKRKRTKNNP